MAATVILMRFARADPHVEDQHGLRPRRREERSASVGCECVHHVFGRDEPWLKSFSVSLRCHGRMAAYSNGNPVGAAQ